MQMGRDVAGLRVDKKPNLVNVKSDGTVHVAPRVTPEKVPTKDYEPEDHTVKEIALEHSEKQDGLAVISKNYERREKVIQAEVQKSTDKKTAALVKPESGTAVKETADSNSIKEPIPPQKQSSSNDHANSIETNEPKSIDLFSPKTAIKQANSPLMATKQLQPNNKLYYDEEDNWSLASSTATSRTLRSKVTVPVAPRFTVTNRLQRRKEFYNKLEEKHKALEKERLEYEARTKEEEAAAIKRLRKNMVVKAKPVPSFYREGPPPKVELKKLPVTRAKSPNLTRRKSFGDAINLTPQEKGSLGRATRHSVGVYKEGKSSPITPKSNPKSKERVDSRLSNGNNKVNDRVKETPEKVNETKENTQVKEQGTMDVTFES